MKKIIIAIALLLPSFAFASFDRSLQYGMSGVDISGLQELLISENCFNHEPTGYFGLITLGAVKCFQGKYHIPTTGYFGLLSRAQANRIVVDITASSTAQAIEESGTSTPQASTSSPTVIYVPIVSSGGGVYINPPLQAVQSVPLPINTSPQPMTTISLGQPVCNADGSSDVPFIIEGDYKMGYTKILKTDEPVTIDQNIIWGPERELGKRFSGLLVGNYSYLVNLYSVPARGYGNTFDPNVSFVDKIVATMSGALTINSCSNQ